MELLWTIAHESPQWILEANFRPHSAYEQNKVAALSAPVVEVYCWCRPDQARRRYAERAVGPARHPAHVLPVLSDELLAQFDRPIGAGALVRVDTTHPVDIESVARAVSACWSPVQN